MRALPLLLVATACVVNQSKPSNPCLVNGQSPCKDPNRTQCVNENGAARCLCDQGFIARPSGACEAVSASNCPEHAGDSAEPDDCIAKAKPMVPGDPSRTQTIDPIGDYDFVSFTAAAKNIYTVTAK